MQALFLLFCLAYGSGKEIHMNDLTTKKYTKPSVDKIKAQLTDEQYKVTQESGTEAPFKNKYWDNKDDGIYVDIVTGEPLFSSLDKYKSGTGWPSFTKPIDKKFVKEIKEGPFWPFSRTEVRSQVGDSHLGHVFDDGPQPTGLRYCMNSAALRFIPKDKMKEEGYGEYLKLFEKKDEAVGKSEAFDVATLAGGCFWGVEELIRKLPGVVETEVGYTGGSLDHPSYDIVKLGQTGHTEAIQIKYDPKKVSYEEILRYFFRLHDPTTVNQQGNDVGTQYRSVIFYNSQEQQEIAEKVKEEVDRSGKWKKKVVTEIVPAKTFYPAESYHQDYLQKHPQGYTCHFLRD